ncbi:PH domain-containing protein [Fodinibius salinus]|uniref:PH domain-containing protein n=1 Tax=Fodinibius salinus TaxID=860790 RepID=A0A5D3YND2_9BACT|nr:PH domain-containing protein [Fodinibius salinus]TYP94848.1 PH domain-containing protein [Fodinibius salinus]
MSKQFNDSTITLEPSWKNHIVGYLLSILCIPLLGIGFIGLYWVYIKQHTYSYTFSDTQLTSQGKKYERHIDLVNIKKIRVDQTFIQRKMGVGDIILQTSASSVTLQGLEGPEKIKQLLEKAIFAEQQRHKEKEESKPKEPEHNPGSMEKMNYLTGLWQQGLVSDEDYKEEKKHFE